MKTVHVIGSGMAGLGAAHRLSEHNIESIILEKSPYFGGHTASHEFGDGFVFDEGPHISFTRNARIKSLLADAVDGNYREVRAKVNNYWQGHWIKHPAQCNLYGLPTDLIVKIIKEFSELQQPEKELQNYAEWLYASYGKTFSETFPLKYTKKYHTTTAENLSIDWLGPRLYRPDMEEVLRGALSSNTKDVHYVSEFRYPEKGGFVSFLKKFIQKPKLKLSHKVIEIDVELKTMRFEYAGVEKYEHLISSMPLPEIIKVIKNVPDTVKQAADKLSCSEVVVVNLGISRPDVFDAHWTYFYDDDYIFTRLSTPFLQSPNNTPENCSSLQAECYFSKKYKPLTKQPQQYIEPVINDLMKCGILKNDDKILFKNAMHIPYANVIFDLERKAALRVVHDYLDEVSIAYCGRYGKWEYIWTDESFISGEIAAEKVIKSF